MRRTKYEPKVTVVTYDGRVFTGEEFLANPPKLSPERIQKIADDYAMEVDPRYRASVRAQRRFERTEARRLELEAQQAKIQNDLAQL